MRMSLSAVSGIWPSANLYHCDHPYAHQCNKQSWLCSKRAIGSAFGTQVLGQKCGTCLV